MQYEGLQQRRAWPLPLLFVDLNPPGGHQGPCVIGDAYR